MRTTEQSLESKRQDLVLIGGGHTHALVLLRWAMAPLSGVRLTLVSERSTSPYSGMLPGLVAGQYRHGDIHIDLRNLCRHAGARFIHARVAGLDYRAKQVRLEGRPELAYDLLSINIGATPDLSVPGAAEFSIPVKPITDFWQRWQSACERLLRSSEPQDIAVVGGGAGSVELAFAMAHRLANAGARHRIHLVTRGEDLLADYPAAMRRWLHRRLRARGIQVHCGFEVSRVDARGIEGGAGQRLDADHVFWCTQGRAVDWLRQSGLETTPQGFVRVQPTLQSLTHADLFAAGDCAWIDEHPLPRAGVFAVREAPVLFDNLKRHLQQQPLRRYRPQRHFLSLLACGGEDAVGARGPVSLAGKWVWRWKDRIDRRFMAMLQTLSVMPPPQRDQERSLEPPAMRCGGCGAKVGADVLQQALASLKPGGGQDILCDLQTPDDAAVIALPGASGQSQALVQSVDALKPLFDDPYLFARVTTQHALSDLFAMHAKPHSAQLLVHVPVMAETLQVRDLSQLLAGVNEELARQGASLLGGHTLEGDGLQLGLSVNGFARPQRVLRKAGAMQGDALVLTKALGTGAIFSAAMRGAAEAAWVDAAIASMLVGNALAADILAEQGARALTDVTGFGLIGHLSEMLKPGGLGAVVHLDRVPALPGALDCIRRGYQSTLSPANQRTRHALRLDSVVEGDPRYTLLFDPQTSGGLLAALPAQAAQQCIDLLAARDIPAVVVGFCEGASLRVQG